MKKLLNTEVERNRDYHLTSVASIACHTKQVCPE